MTQELTPNDRMHDATAKLYAFTLAFGAAIAIMFASQYTTTIFDPYATYLPIVVLYGGAFYLVWNTLPIGDDSG